jgi:hypothetical protein
MAQIADDEDGIDVRNKLNATGLRKNNFAATTDPGTGDDTGDGYEVGSVWINTTAGTVWVCENDTSTEAVWVQVYDAATLKSDTTATLTAGYGNTSHPLGTITSGTVTPDVANGHHQHGTIGGAFTLAPPSAVCEIAVEFTNNGSAGSVTTSGFTFVAGEHETTDGSKYIARITKTHNYSSLIWQALQ